MTRLATTLRTLLALGPASVARVALYRLGLKYGMHPVQRVRAAIPVGPFFAAAAATLGLPAVRGWRDHADYFGAHRVALGQALPDWHANPLQGTRVQGVEREWWRIPDFDPAVGDIKAVWEASRFDWVLAFAQAARRGDPDASPRLERWLQDWTERNPPYRGPNWKCGQEASIRVMHLAAALLLLGQEAAPLPGLLDLVEVHLARIAPTTAYARGQDNNHGTSEAAALFIGGALLAQHGRAQGGRWQRRGRRMLEERVAALVAPDGSFSQYSVNYHRVMLDTLSLAETWRRRAALPEFSPTFRQRAAKAADWLRLLTDAGNGDAPNLGANDGARLLPLTDGYRDFRPSVQLACVLFLQRRAYVGRGDWDLPLDWLGLAHALPTCDAPDSRVFDQGGFAVLRAGAALAVLRYPRFRYRPSQADLLHLDFWHDGVNLLRDAGTYGYNAPAPWPSYFPGAAAHNTVQFDQRDPMPRLGRFLFGDWPRTDAIEPLRQDAAEVSFAAAYRDRQGAAHWRAVALSARWLQVRDRVSGFRERAVLRWRLAPGDWVLHGRVLGDGRRTLEIDADVATARIELVPGHESRHYLELSPLPVLEVEVRQPGEIVTKFRFDT